MAAPLTSARPAHRPLARAVALLTLAFALGLGVGLVPSGKAALACSCATPLPPSQSLQAAAAVFDGTVVRVERVDPNDDLSDLRVTFVVHTQWKGVTSGRYSVTTESNSAMCGIHFNLGYRYIVYVTGGLGGTTVSSCSRTHEYQSEEADALGPDSPPPGAEPYVGKWNLRPPTVGCPRCAAPPAPREAMADADAVFHGRAIGVTFLGTDGGFDRVVTFQNLGWWKGSDTPTIDVRVPWNVWFCGSPFGGNVGVTELGEFLVYAKRDPSTGALTIALCDRTKSYDAAEAAALGTPNPPRPDQATGTPDRPARDTPTPHVPATDTPPATTTPEPGGIYLPWLAREP